GGRLAIRLGLRQGHGRDARQLMTQAAPNVGVFEHSFADELPELCVPWSASAVPAPQLLVLNEQLADELELHPDWLRSPDGVAMLVGAVAPAMASPVAQAYAGHQFGGFSPSLGDGRALLLGEVVDASGRRRDIHLKGSG